MKRITRRKFCSDVIAIGSIASIVPCAEVYGCPNGPLRIADLDVAGYIEFEGQDYRYWWIEVEDTEVKIAEYSLEENLLITSPSIKYRNSRARYLDEHICYYAKDDELVRDIKAVIVGEK